MPPSDPAMPPMPTMLATARFGNTSETLVNRLADQAWCAAPARPISSTALQSPTCVTSKIGNTATAGMVIGLSLTVVHLIGIPITGTSVNPARSLGPALIVGGTALSQVWLFIVAPLVGGALAAGLHWFVYPSPPGSVDPEQAAAAAAVAAGE